MAPLMKGDLQFGASGMNWVSTLPGAASTTIQVACFAIVVLATLASLLLLLVCSKSKKKVQYGFSDLEAGYGWYDLDDKSTSITDRDGIEIQSGRYTQRYRLDSKMQLEAHFIGDANSEVGTPRSQSDVFVLSDDVWHAPSCTSESPSHVAP